MINKNIFIKKNLKDVINKKKEAETKIITVAIKIGGIASEFISSILPEPMNMEYEKVFYPFIIFTKKRYVGNKYENNPEYCYQSSMGIVMKRRDNAPIVKMVCGGIIDKLLNEKSKNNAIIYTQNILMNIINDKFDISKFIITKTLNGKYKDRTRIAHAILADRIASRDAGNKIQTGDRIPFVYIVLKNKHKQKILQGNRIEHPDYVLENKLKIDYLFYITNQIMNPSMQLLELICNNPGDIFKDCMIIEQNRNNNTSPIEFFLTKHKDEISDTNINVKNTENCLFFN